MKVDGKLGAGSAAAVIEEARRHEKAGYDGLWSSESAHDPFLPLVLAAEHTEQMELGTAIAVAFARSPMQLAYTAHDLQATRADDSSSAWAARSSRTSSGGSRCRGAIPHRACGSSSWPCGRSGRPGTTGRN